MIEIKKILGALVCLVFILSACEKHSEEPAFDVTPRIELVSMSTTELVQFQDTLTLVLKYEDGDGDLGSRDPDESLLFVRDNRLESADEYYVGLLAPEGANASITGNLSVNLSTVFLFGNGSQESTFFTIYMKDRAGNESNQLDTEQITILKE